MCRSIIISTRFQKRIFASSEITANSILLSLYVPFSFEPVKLYNLEQAIQFIHKFNGLCAVAHPWLYNYPIRVCKEALQYGVDGVECFPPRHHPEASSVVYRTFCHKHNLFCCSGSDFHGVTSSEVGIGENVFPEKEVGATLELFEQKGILYRVFFKTESNKQAVNP